MHAYQVVATTSEGVRAALCDGDGRFHLARFLNAEPPVGLALDGDRPHLGFSMLYCAENRAWYRVNFERINGDSVDAFRGSGPLSPSTGGPASAPDPNALADQG